MFWEWLGLTVLVVVVLFLLLALAAHCYIVWTYLGQVIRIFREKPLFIVPVGQPVSDAEIVRFPTSGGLTLCGCYFRTPKPRLGVILFGLEFGSLRWAALPYCSFLREAGYDIFTFEVRNQGDSDCQAGYDPLQWVTHYEVEDFKAAIAYLKSRGDADPRGLGLFGISKGAGAGVLAAAADPFVRCCVTDGMFATHTTMIPYMYKWAFIYCRVPLIVDLIPFWYYRLAAYLALRRISREKHCRFPHLEWHIGKLAPRPLLMIHGGADNYIKPDMAKTLFDLAGEPKELWLVDKAKHNQAFHIAKSEYQSRLLHFFHKHLAKATPLTLVLQETAGVGATNGVLKPLPQPVGLKS